MNKTYNIFRILIAIAVISLMVNTVSAVSGVFTETTKYKKFDERTGLHILTIDIKIPEKGYIKYYEEYFSVDSYGQLKSFSSSTFFSGDVNHNILIHIDRPKHRYSSSWKFIKKHYVINDIKTTVLIDFSKYW